MNKQKKKVLLVILLSSLILVFRGHGFAPIGLMWFFAFTELFSSSEIQDFSLKLFGNYEQTIPIAVILFLFGNLILVTSLFLKKKIKDFLEILGILLLHIGFYFLTNALFRDTLALFSFITGIPFLYHSVQFLIKKFKFSQ